MDENSCRGPQDGRRVPREGLVAAGLRARPRAWRALDFLRAEKIPFWSPDQWPANSPDLNPLDYAIWSIVNQRACKTRPPSVTTLKARVSKIWNELDAAEIRKICRRFRTRLQQCVDENGSYFD